MVGGLEIVDIIKRLDELDMGVFGFLPGDLEKSGIIRFEDVANIQKITGILESGTEELWYINGEIKGPSSWRSAGMPNSTLKRVESG